MRSIVRGLVFLGLMLSLNVYGEDQNCTDDESTLVSAEYIELPQVPQEPDCSGCYEKHCKWARCYYKEWECKTKKETFENKHVRYVPQYYQKRVCRYVPQYYYETYVRYVPEYYSTYESYDVPEYKIVKKCKYKPKYYYKKKKGCQECSDAEQEQEPDPDQEGSDVE